MAITITGYPVDGAGVTETPWYKMSIHHCETGVLADIDNELFAYTDGTGMTVKVDTGHAYVNGGLGINPALAALPIAAAHGVNDRIDLVIVRRTLVTNIYELDVLTGVAAVAPVAPTPTQTLALWEEPLSEVLVDAGVAVIVAGKTTDKRVMINEGGGIMGGYLGGYNLVKNFPSLEGADGAQPEWWEEVGTGTLTEEDALGEGIPEQYERVLKYAQGAAAGPANYMVQTYSNIEPILAGEDYIMSCSAWVYTANAGTVTMELYDGAAAAVLATVDTDALSDWTYLSLQNVHAETVSMQFRIYHSVIGATTYVAMPVVNVGKRVIPWQQRKLVYKGIPTNLIVNGVDPGGGGYVAVNLQPSMGDLGVVADLAVMYSNNTNLGGTIYIRRFGDVAVAAASQVAVRNTAITVNPAAAMFSVLVNDAKQIEYDSSAAAGDAESVFISLSGYWEWET